MAILIPCISPDIKREYQILTNELRKFSEGLATKPKVIVISKMDLAPEDFTVPRFRGLKVVPISAATGENIEALKDALWEHLQAALPEEV